MPRPLSEKSRSGLATVPYNGLSTRGLYSARQSDCRVQLRHVNRFVTILLQVGVVPFDKALIVSDVSERSRKLLLKQKEVAEAFASWRDAFVSFSDQLHKHFCHGSISTAWILLQRVCLSCKYGLNGEKHVLRINPGRSDRSVPTESE